MLYRTVSNKFVKTRSENYLRRRHLPFTGLYRTSLTESPSRPPPYTHDTCTGLLLFFSFYLYVFFFILIILVIIISSS